MPRTAGSRVAFFVCLILLLAACGESGPVARTAAQRLDDAVALIAKALGKSTTEVRTGIDRKLPGATVDELAAQAERTAAKTAEMERLAAREAQAAEREQAMIDTIYGATCDYIEIADELASTPPEQRWPKFEAMLAQKLAEHAFDSGQANVQALSKDVLEFWDSVSNNSTRPMSDIATDLACFAS
jgi:hypothetical protein